jgi:hypothetical protein
MGIIKRLSSGRDWTSSILWLKESTVGESEVKKNASGRKVFSFDKGQTTPIDEWELLGRKSESAEGGERTERARLFLDPKLTSWSG